MNCPPPCPRSQEIPRLCFGQHPVQHQTWRYKDERNKNHWCPGCRHSFDADCDRKEER